MGRLIAGLLAGACSLLVLASPAAAVPAVAVTPGNSLLLFDTSSPGTVSPRNIAGLEAGQTVRGIDLRPSTGEVFVSTAAGLANSFVTTYRLDANTGLATLVGATGAPLGAAGDIVTGYDFSPVADRIRYVTGSTGDENARINPANGALAAEDAPLNPAATDVVAEAYDRNRPGSTLTTLYAIDRNNHQLARQGDVDGTPLSPNSGIITGIGPLGFNLHASNDGGFDISAGGVAYAAFTDAADNLTRLYTIILATGAATPIGPIGNGLTQVFSLAILDTDLDADGLPASADNCAAAANADQADLDGDGQGDVCDADQDGDGLSDAVEAQLGTNPRSTDSDGDGRADSADSCPTLAAGTANGCPDAAAPAPALSFTIRGFPRRIALRTLRARGLSLTLEPNQAASFRVELRGRLRGSRIARVGDFILAERRLGSAAGRRTVRLVVPRSQRRRLRRGSRLTLRVSAADALGRSVVATRRLTVR